jgi:uncharacterized membrane protein
VKKGVVEILTLIALAVLCVVALVLATPIALELARALRPLPRPATIVAFVVVINGLAATCFLVLRKDSQRRAIIAGGGFLMLNLVLVLAATGH